MRLRITALHYYPVKSCAGTRVEEAVLDERGIRNDRRWMVVTPGGEFLTQRECPSVAVVRPEVSGDRLVLRARGMEDLQAPAEGGDSPIVRVRVWNDTCEAIDLGDEAARWLNHFLQQPCRLVTLAPGFVRPVSPSYARAEDQVGFADGFPLLVTCESSLQDLNRRLSDPVPMSRFRPNIVLEGSGAWEEDRWTRLRVPARGVELRVVKPCARCVITTIDQASGISTGEEPLRTLGGFRLRTEGKARGAMFGQNCIHNGLDAPLTLAVGDNVEVTE